MTASRLSDFLNHEIDGKSRLTSRPVLIRGSLKLTGDDIILKGTRLPHWAPSLADFVQSHPV
jgi:hypothetical protein